MGQKHVRADRASRANHSVTAHDGCSRVDGDAIFQGRMPLGSAELLPARQRPGHKAYTLIHLHVIANLARLADHSARAMVDKEVRADLRPGCKSIPVRACAHSVMMRGISGIFF